MGFLTGTLPPPLNYEVHNLEKQVLSRLERCCNALRATGGAAGAALQRWFGDSSGGFRKEMLTKVAKMRTVLNGQGIECITDTTTIYVSNTDGSVKKVIQQGDPTENAAAYHDVGGVFGGGVGERVTRMTDMTNHIKIGPGFKSLPATALGAVAGWTGQDKLETLLHELSHYVHGTKDKNLADGTTAYGADDAKLLVTQSANRAKKNAENWGFFIEECGL